MRNINTSSILMVLGTVVATILDGIMLSMAHTSYVQSFEFGVAQWAAIGWMLAIPVLLVAVTWMVVGYQLENTKTSKATWAATEAYAMEVMAQDDLDAFAQDLADEAEAQHEAQESAYQVACRAEIAQRYAAKEKFAAVVATISAEEADLVLMAASEDAYEAALEYGLI